jgi:hypothetical protein
LPELRNVILAESAGTPSFIECSVTFAGAGANSTVDWATAAVEIPSQRHAPTIALETAESSWLRVFCAYSPRRHAILFQRIAVWHECKFNLAAMSHPPSIKPILPPAEIVAFPPQAVNHSCYHQRPAHPSRPSW